MEHLVLRDGRTVLVDDTAVGPDDDRPVLVWHHETPHTGRILDPIRAAADARGLRVIALTRPGFGGADPLPGRDVAAGARDLAEVLDGRGTARGTNRAVVLGGSGGGPHALAAAALLPDRVAAAAVFASPAPFADTPAWWDGMADDGGLRSARAGREARIAWGASAAFDPAQFVDADWTALDGDWAALGRDASAAAEPGLLGAADDDVAFVTDWGFRLADVRCPVLVVQGGRDRVVPAAHGQLLADALPTATLDERRADGHVSVLSGVPQAMDRLVAAARE
ncbi:alpha/beta fold hydrolase [Curtobacterium pusillum]|uniref:alpha/beta fold hydrolase n=1 Tax=Curtobacterium pusillum TaxID=69373 RepID=UPI0011A2FF88|nr:alpha/beta hydrolase [Curtobacterium pusillum]